MFNRLPELAEGLVRFGIADEPICIKEGVLFCGYCLSENYVAWNGRSEHPALAFALLDVLEKAGHWTAVRFKGEEGDERHGCEVLPEEGERRVKRYGATRTEAIVNAFLSALDAGLLPEVPR